MECLFCRREQEEWGSWLVLMPINVKFTVCPKCRMFSFNDAFIALMEEHFLSKPDLQGRKVEKK